VVVAIQLTQLYQQEVQQKLNLTLADHIASDIPLLADGTANQPALEELFHTLMIVNPSIELYLVDTSGSILAFNAPPGKVQLDKIELDGVLDYLDGAESLPIKGVDPRNPGTTKAFSAAPVYENEQLSGYLYIVLGGENYDTVVQMIQDSYILRLLFWIGITAFVLSLIAALLSFNWLTRRITRMSAGVRTFNTSQFKDPIKLPHWRRKSNGDEIDDMGVTIEKMSQTIVDQIQRLRQSDVTRRELIANISHDLRTPLTSMQGYLETLQIKKNELSAEDQEKYLELAIENSRRLATLVADLFELAMLETPDSKANIESFSLAELVQDVTQKFGLKTAQKKLQLSCDIPEDAPFVHGDIAMIERVLENLIENAIKFSSAGDTIQISVAPAADGLTVKVLDTGPGIPADDIPHLFERFYRVDKSRSDETKSNGLGLAIAHRILQLHQSTISVQSMPGQGSCFSFELPTAS
jgi:signal transduction histidine kinase